MDFKEYIQTIDQLYHVGNTTEHSFRGALASYLQSILKNFVVTNEPRRIDCGAPDYVITQKNVPVAFLEAKDVNDGDLDGRRQHKDQFNRYKSSLNRIIFTDYLDFHLYVGGEYQDAVRIAETRGDHIVGIPENEAKFSEMVLHLATEGRQRITSSSALAKQMAAKAHLLADAVKKSIAIDGEDGDSDMAAQLRAFRNVLIHDLKPEEFADIYAQTIVYGLFTARLNDQTPEDFSRQEAAELIPKSNPFLRKIFQSIAVYDLDESIAWIVEDLASMFSATDAERIMRNYGGNKRHSDPIVHFYEDFLAEYDPKLRKARGVWYTPAPVVKFIVSSIDEILQTEFNLPMGLADDSTITINRAIQQSKDGRTTDGKKHEMVPVHRVQILDPATGTGTFLAEIIQQVRDKFEGMEGVWPSYVENSLIPRLHGFEILMASYTIAHLKLSMTLKATGYDRTSKNRLNVFLTNSLEEATPRSADLFAKWLADEADEASRVKTETPVMICTGNPPYSVSSQNNGKWITDLVADYKKNLAERNIQPLSDDYIKFIRLGHHYINKKGEGILAFISNNSFLDGIIHRQMRKCLLDEFDKIFILDLHGNSRKKEIAPDGTVDKNVFDIMQGVSINIFVKTGKKTKGAYAEVFHKDLYGSRESKYEWLKSMTFLLVDWETVYYSKPFFFFKPKDFSLKSSYEKGLKVSDLFVVQSTGITTCKDKVNYWDTEKEVQIMVQDLLDLSESDFREKYSTGADSRDWVYNRAKSDVQEAIQNNTLVIAPIEYRQFDKKYCVYTGKTNGIVAWPRYRSLSHLLHPQNISLIVPRQTTQDWHHAFVSNMITDMNILASAKLLGAGVQFPLYITVAAGRNILEKTVSPNFNPEVVKSIEDALGEDVVPQEVFDYIYAVLHCPKYRETYKEFLKIDFPRIPYPTDKDQYHRLVSLGAKLRQLHLMEWAQNWEWRISFPVPGENIVETTRYHDGRVFINDTQFFGGVSELAWNFFIGGYQPAQKWLKDRRGRKLEYQDILHYGRIIYALEETDRIMKEIDRVF
ncbi:MAG: DNA methyltransferase [Bacteroidales bacterium]|nr:DNA methyltransferase [Bacteroidales bacterium]